jgi:hypothetical protein
MTLAGSACSCRGVAGHPSVMTLVVVTSYIRSHTLGLRSDEKPKLAAMAFTRGQTLTKRNQLI